MATEKRNTFLDASDSEEDGGAYESDEDRLTKGSRAVKRRKLEDAAEDDDRFNFDDEDFDEEKDDGDVAEEEEYEDEPKGVDNQQSSKSEARLERKARQSQTGDEEEDDEGEDDESDNDHPAQKDTAGKRKPPALTKPLAKKNLVDTEKAIRRSGVVYLSRIPPFMKPVKLRQLLAPYGRLNRMHLTPEDAVTRARRLRGGGNRRRTYVEGWVEFVRKRDAKRAVDLLNAQMIGGKKSSYYRDDLWSLVYLRGFKWHHLTDQIATENAERASRMRAELAQTARENKLFLQNVDRAKMLEGMEAKAAAKAARKEEAGGGSSSGKAAETTKPARSFKQIKKVDRQDGDEAQPEHVQRVLSKIF